MSWIHGLKMTMNNKLTQLLHIGGTYEGRNQLLLVIGLVLLSACIGNQDTLQSSTTVVVTSSVPLSVEDKIHSIDYVLEHKDSIIGKNITIQAFIELGDIICLQIECPPHRPNCNRCSSNLYAKDSTGNTKIKLNKDYNGKLINCMEVKPGETESTCPFIFDREYLLTVNIQETANGELILQLLSFKELKGGES